MSPSSPDTHQPADDPTSERATNEELRTDPEYARLLDEGFKFVANARDDTELRQWKTSNPNMKFSTATAYEYGNPARVKKLTHDSIAVFWKKAE